MTDDGAGDAQVVVRRAPFSDNPAVGARGQRTQQRILDAALRVFGEVGFHQCSVDRIAKVAGCSRVSFYQYFSSKEDVFRHLAGQVARQFRASAEMLDPLTADAAGWAALRAWVGRYADVYERYEPVFHAFQAAVERDEALAGGSVRVREADVARLQSRLATATLPPRQLDSVLRLLLACLTRTHDVVGALRAVAPGAYPPDPFADAVTDVLHRTLFGLDATVNTRAPVAPSPPALAFPADLVEAMTGPIADGDGDGQPGGGRPAFAALLDAGRDAFVARGYHGTRVDDIVEAAGVSHGAFYRYFPNKERLVELLALRAMRAVSTAFRDIPDMTDDVDEDRAALRRWLRRYHTTQSGEAAMLSVWVDATLQDAALRADSAPALDWGRRRMARFLAPRGFGDVDTEAVVMLALVEAFSASPNPAGDVDATVHIIERGLLGRGREGR